MVALSKKVFAMIKKSAEMNVILFEDAFKIELINKNANRTKPSKRILFSAFD